MNHDHDHDAFPGPGLDDLDDLDDLDGNLARFEDTLRLALREGAPEFAPSGAGASEIMRRARRQQHRQRVALAGAAAAVAGLGVWGAASLGDDTQHVAVGGDALDGGVEVTGSVSIEASDAVAAEPIVFVWSDPEEASMPVAADAFVASDGTYYAVDWASDRYRSSDGVHWEPLAAHAPAEEPWMGALVERDGVLYALGAADGPEGRVASAGVSTDAGASWRTADIAAPADVPAGLTLPLRETRVTTRLAGGSGTPLVAVVDTTFYPEYHELLPFFVPDGSARPGPEGIELYSCTVPPGSDIGCPPEDLVSTVPWSRIGVDGQDDLTTRAVYVSPDGIDWESVGDPFDGRFVARLVASPEGLYATVFTEASDGGQVLETLQSADGRSWSHLPTPVDGAAVYGMVGGRLVAIREGDRPVVYTSPDGGATWSSIDVADLVAGADPTALAVHGVDVGPLGVAFVLDGNGEGRSVVFSADGVTWTLIDAAELGRAAGGDLTQLDVMVGVDRLIVSGFSAADPGADGTPLRFAVVGVPAAG